jgi:hypothetical protein
MDTSTETNNSAPAPGEPMTREEFLARLEAQGVPQVLDYAFRCVACGAVQSGRSLVLAGATTEAAEGSVGYACVGRWTGAGSAVFGAGPRAETVGCDWTIGGLLGSLGRGVRVAWNGRVHERFYLATPEEAQELAQRGGVPFRSTKGAQHLAQDATETTAAEGDAR